MDTIYKVLIAVLTFVITSALTILAKKRQLYVVVQTQFKQTALSASGVLSQIFVHNRGNSVEEDISVIIDPALRIELLASDTASLVLVGNTLVVNRLHKGKSASALILVENGDFDMTRIVLATSKTTEAKLIKTPSEVPPNALLVFCVGLAFFGLLPLMYGSMQLYIYVTDNYRQGQIEKQLRVQLDQGWHALDMYADSELRKSYGSQEFPIEFTSRFEKGKVDTAEFEIYNKTATSLDVYADKNNKDEKSTDMRYTAHVTIPPMSHQPLTVRVPESDPISHKPEISFSLNSGKEWIYKMFFVPPTFVPGIVGARSKVEKQLSVQFSHGWSELDTYAVSELRKSYGDQEFPVEYKGRFSRDGRDNATFEIFNKTSLPLKVFADVNGKVVDSTDIEYFGSAEVPPMSHAPFTVRVPAPAPVSGLPEIQFHFMSGKEFIHEPVFTVPQSDRLIRSSGANTSKGKKSS